jgi:chemotaxis protein MotB
MIRLLAAGTLLAGCGASKKLEQANAQIGTLNEQVATLTQASAGLRQQLAEAQQTIGQLKVENKQYGEEARDCRVAKEAILKNLEAMNQELAAKGTSLSQLRKDASASIEQLEAMGVEFYYARGRIHMLVPAEYVFKSGSAAVGQQGKNALQVIARVLNQYPNLETMVVGNTDNIPYKSGVFRDNWGLSTERANAVVRILANDYQVNPSRLIAAGRAEYDPISDNSLSDGRALNRRIEFVLIPDLSALWETSAD